MQKRKFTPFISDEILCAEYEAVYRYVLSLCRDETEAQDITQETFLRAMKAAESFKGDSSLYTWLCTIGKNIWFNKCRKQGREVSGEVLCDMGHDRGNSEISVEQMMVEQDLLMEIHRVLHKLNEPYKEVFSLRIFGQLSFKEIGQLFEKTESWARVTYYRAKKTMIETLRKDGIL